MPISITEPVVASDNVSIHVPTRAAETAAASAAAKANTSAVTTTNAPAATWADNDVRDATVGLFEE